MLERSLILTAVAFSIGFGTGTYWQSLLRSLDKSKHEAADARQVSAGYIASASLADTINTVEENAIKEISHATNETDVISHGLAVGTVRLQLNAEAATCPSSTGTGMVDGARAGHDPLPRQYRKAQPAPQLKRSAEPDYLALRAGVQKCRAKVTGLQAILKEERRLGSQ